jgi:FMN phosphatase YigB (HAD superfamily)
VRKIYSFDVFDTVLIRTWSHPSDLFEELGVWLFSEKLISTSIKDWCTLRMESEKKVRRLSDKQDILLQEVYQYIQTLLNWSDHQTEQSMQKEIQLELYSLRPVPVHQKLINALHQQGEQVVYISDMYLPKDAIKEALELNNIWSNTDILYVSSEFGALKRTGKLFQICLEDLDIVPKQLFHIGDNIRSDVEKSRELGINSQLFSSTHLNRYEKWIAGNPALPSKFRSLLSGSSRLSRLQSFDYNPHLQTIWDTSANVISPVMFGFVHWCLNEAEYKGIKRLYFLARDGQILLKIAQILCRKWGYQIDCRYLYASRQAWHFPSIQSVQEEELNWIFEMPAFSLSVRSACKGVNIAPEEVCEALAKYGFLEVDWDKDLDPRERSQLRKAFCKPELSHKIADVARQYFETTVAYLRQEGIGDGIRFGIVDIGWKGSLQSSLKSLLDRSHQYSDQVVDGFYFGLLKRDSKLSQNNLSAYFHDDAVQQRSAKAKHGYRRLLEIFVAADHGSTMEYENKNGYYTPVFHQEKNVSALDWGLKTLQEAVVDFTERVTDALEPSECKDEDLLVVCEFLLDEFINRPTNSEALAFGQFQDSPYSKEDVLFELAPQITIRDVFSHLVTGSELSPHVWKAGVKARNPGTYQLYSKAKSFRRKVIVLFSKIKQLGALKLNT